MDSEGFNCSWGASVQTQKKKTQFPKLTGLWRSTDWRDPGPITPPDAHSHPFRSRLKENGPGLISDAEGTSGQAARGDHGRGGSEPCSDTLHVNQRSSTLRPQRLLLLLLQRRFCPGGCADCQYLNKTTWKHRLLHLKHGFVQHFFQQEAEL